MKNCLNPPRGHGEYRVVPFCLTNATAVCQARVNYVPRDPLNTCVFVYPDDLLIVRRVEVSVSVLQRPGETTLKAEMFLSSLGFIARQGCIQMHPTEVSAGLDWPGNQPPLCPKWSNQIIRATED